MRATPRGPGLRATSHPVFSFRLGPIGVVSTGIYSLDRSLFRYVAPGATDRRLVPLHTTVTLDTTGASFAVT